MSDLHARMLVWMSLARSVAALTHGLDKASQEELGLPLTEMALLLQLGKADGPARMVDFARRMMVTKAAITKIVDRVESAGLCVREPSSSDRRVTHIAITPQGKKLFKKAQKLLYSWLQENLFDHLTEEEMEHIRSGLGRVLDAYGIPDTVPSRPE